MRWLFALGFLVIAMALASAGFLRGDLCAGTIGCIGATNGGITLHGKATP